MHKTDTLDRKWEELIHTTRINDSLTAHFPPRSGYKWIGAVTTDAIKGNTLVYYDGVMNFEIPFEVISSKYQAAEIKKYN